MIHIDYDAYHNYILLVSIKDFINNTPPCFCNSILTVEKMVEGVRSCGPFKTLAIEEICKVANEHDAYVNQTTASKIYDIIMNRSDRNEGYVQLV